MKPSKLIASSLLAFAAVALHPVHAQADSDARPFADVLAAAAEQPYSAIPASTEPVLVAANSSVCRVCPQGYHCHCDPKTGTCWCIVKQPK